MRILESMGPLRTGMRELNTLPGYQLVQLDRLDEAAVGQLLADLWDDQVPSELVTEIHTLTGGNPLFVEEVARGFMEDRLVYPVGPRWVYPEDVIIRLPATVSEAVEGRIQYLDAETRELLTQIGRAHV